MKIIQRLKVKINKFIGWGLANLKSDSVDRYMLRKLEERRNKRD